MAKRIQRQSALVEPILTTDHPVAQCVDLKATFGTRYRYEWDEAYSAERPEYRAVEAPWLTIIPCKFGRIFPWGGRTLAAYCDAGGMKCRELQNLPGVAVGQGGDVRVPGTNSIVSVAS